MTHRSGLAYEVSGKRGLPEVLLLHGFMGSSADWRGVEAALGDRAFCIAPDLPGHGASVGLEPAAYTMEQTAKAVERTLDELEVRRPVVVGYSMGGRLALYLALRCPDRCAAIFLESASPGLEGEEERAVRRDADEERARWLESGDFGGFLRAWYRQPLFASLARDEGLLRRTIEARRQNDPWELARSLRGIGTGSQPSLWEELGGLSLPALAVAGERDTRYAGISSRMASVSPKVEPVTMPDVGHNAHDEAPEEYAALLGRFLDRLSRTRGEPKIAP